jgi:chemotaxis protein MotA
MSSNGIGFFLGILVLVIMAIWTSPDKPMQYVDAHGGFVVFVGTAVIAVIAIPKAELKSFFPMVRVITRKIAEDSVEIVELLVAMADQARLDMSGLASFKEKTSDLFLKDAIDLLTEGFDEDAIHTVLKRRIEVQKERESNQMKMFKSLGKYPPAAGLMGTVMGMIALLGTLGQEGAGEKIGPAMSVALAATLYGVICANMLILPVADNLMFRTQKSVAKRQMILEGIMLVKRKTPGILVRELLLSHLAPGVRGDVKKGDGRAGSVSNAA